ncbi:cysteine proteinase [Gigaspora margarita]|uniref:Cysteine proteinase n=1 Tax=Gigaspora margarita TaxID=4874 RepID=A0A8H3XIM5_GIGMA|nr:cysteine proteinase [Gigaspora margarita]
MPKLFGHEIKDFQHHTWNFIDWSNAERKVISPEFEVGGCKWNTVLYPFGKSNLSKVSIYLEFINPPEAYSCAQFAFVLWNPEEPTQYIGKYAYCRFNAKKHNWGFVYFCDRDKLFIPSTTQTRSIIENNSCNITTLIRVLEDPTGTLWSDAEKPFAGYIGLKNLGASNTFMNSVIQSLYLIKCLRKAIFQIPTENYQTITSISSALQRIFCRLNVSDTAIEATELTKFFGWNKFFMDIDIRKFIRILFDDLEDKMKNTNVDGTISRFFVGTKKIYIKCINVDYESIRFEEYSDIQLNVKGCSTLEESFDNYVDETLEGDNKYEAEEYGLQVAKKKVIFESLPPVLHIHLNWFEYDAKDDCMIELNHRYEFPKEIDLQKYLSSDVSEVDKFKSHKYLLHGAIVRYRSSKNRYFAWLKTGKNWTKFIDEWVTVASIENNYNAEDNNAYMLIYIRELCVDEILSPIHYKDIPKHLCEQRQKELKNNSMYINVKVMTEEIFKNHKGYGLANFNNIQCLLTLTGLTNFDNSLTEINKFEILKEATYGAFKKMASERFKIPSNKMRFWKITNNPDGINRLRALINGKTFFDKPMKEITGASGRLYMEVLDKPINNKNESFMIFLKYFDPDAQLLKGLGHLYVQKSSKISSIFPIIRKKNQLPPNASLEAYEEKSLSMIKIQPKHIFKDFIQHDGAIICFQKALMSEEIQEHLSVDRIYSIPKFYESLSMNTTIMFRSKFGYKDPIPEFSLILNRNMKFSTITNQVAVHINVDPLRLHLMPEGIDMTNRKLSKIFPFNIMTNIILSEIFPLIDKLTVYYEILDICTENTK